MRFKYKRIFFLALLLILFHIIYKLDVILALKNGLFAFHDDSHINKVQNQIRKRIKFLVKEFNSGNQFKSEKKFNNGIVMISNSKSLETTLKIIKF